MTLVLPRTTFTCCSTWRGSSPLKAVGDSFPVLVLRGLHRQHTSPPPYVAVEPGWVAPWPDFGLRATSNEVNHGVKKKNFFFKKRGFFFVFFFVFFFFFL